MLKYLNSITKSILISLIFSTVTSSKLPAQTQTPTAPHLPNSLILTPPENAITPNENKNPSSLPWLVVSRKPNQIVPVPASTKISDLFTTQGLTPISCSFSQIVIITVNNLYIACASPNSTFPPGNYTVTIPDL